MTTTHISTQAEGEAPIITEQHGATLLIRLNRPERRNALGLEMRAALERAVTHARDEPSIRAGVLTGAGSAFCAGGDLKGTASADQTAYADRERLRRIHIWMRELVHLEKPVIAAVDGPAFGAGFSLALACDFVLATPRTTFCAVFGRVGLVPDMGMFYLLPRIVGLQRAKDLIFSARDVTAAEAHRLGIVFELVEPPDLLPQTMAMAADLCEASTEVIGMSKSVLARSHNLDYDALVELECHAQATARHSVYHHDAVRAFTEKRPTRFRWSRKAGPDQAR